MGKFKIGDAVGIFNPQDSNKHYVHDRPMHHKFYVVNVQNNSSHSFQTLYKVVPDRSDGIWDATYVFESEICEYSKLFEIIYG